MMGLRRRVHILQLLLVSIIVLLSSLGCITHAFSPSAASQKVSPLSLKTVPSRIRPRHNALPTSSHNIDGDKRYPNVDRIDNIITSQIQHGLSTIITSFVIFTAILTSQINSEAFAMTENQQFVVSRQSFLCCFFVQYDIYKNLHLICFPLHRQMYGLQ